MRIRSLIAVGILLVLTASAYSQPERRGDLPALQGRWRTWHDPDDYLVFEIRGTAYTYLRHFADGTERTWGGTFTLDEKATPKRMTQYMKNDQGELVVANLCIYELTGDTLLHSGGGPTRRPDRFLSGGGASGIYRRQ